MRREEAERAAVAAAIQEDKTQKASAHIKEAGGLVNGVVGEMDNSDDEVRCHACDALLLGWHPVAVAESNARF